MGMLWIIYTREHDILLVIAIEFISNDIEIAVNVAVTSKQFKFDWFLFEFISTKLYWKLRKMDFKL